MLPHFSLAFLMTGASDDPLEAAAGAGRIEVMQFLTGKGADISVKDASSNMTLPARNPMGEVLMAAPALADGMMITRGAQNLYAVR